MENTPELPAGPEPQDPNEYTPTEEEINEWLDKWSKILRCPQSRENAIKDVREERRRNVQTEGVEDALRARLIGETFSYMKNFDIAVLMQVCGMFMYVESGGCDLLALAHEMLRSLNRMGLVSDAEFDRLTA